MLLRAFSTSPERHFPDHTQHAAGLSSCSAVFWWSLEIAPSDLRNAVNFALNPAMALSLRMNTELPYSVARWLPEMLRQKNFIQYGKNNWNRLRND
jgi:hypothetical protein